MYDQVPGVVFLAIVGYLVALLTIGLSVVGWLWRDHRRAGG